VIFLPSCTKSTLSVRSTTCRQSVRHCRTLRICRTIRLADRMSVSCLQNLVRAFFCSALSSVADQHGNIKAYQHVAAAESVQISSIKMEPAPPPPPLPSVAMTTEQPAAAAVTVKKESRLKHFFSPIRKKTPAPMPPVAPPLPPIITQQPDVFVSNALPNNLFVSSTSSAASTHENAVFPSPTSSFQVANEINGSKRFKATFLLDWWKSRRAAL